MTHLETALVDLAASIEIPPAPDVAGAVTARLRRPSRSRWRSPSWWQARPATAVAAVAMALLLVVAVIPGTRDTVTGWLGLRGVRLEAPPGTLPGGSALGLGDPVAAAVARTATGFVAELPALGTPDLVLLDEPGRVTAVYLPSPDLPEIGATGTGLLFTQVRIGLDPSLVKGVAIEEGLRFVPVAGGEGMWIEGPHAVFLVGADGTIEVDGGRTSGNTLLWEDDGTTYRIESMLPLARVLQLAMSLDETR